MVGACIEMGHEVVLFFLRHKRYTCTESALLEVILHSEAVASALRYVQE